MNWINPLVSDYYFSAQQVLVGDPKGVGSSDSDSDFEALRRSSKKRSIVVPELSERASHHPAAKPKTGISGVIFFVGTVVVTMSLELCDNPGQA